MKVSAKFLLLDSQATISVPYLRLNMVRLELNEVLVAGVEEVFVLWSAALILYKSPETHTPANVSNQGLLFDELSTKLNAIKAFLKNNPNITLLSTDYENIFIHKDEERRDRVEVPNISPIIVFLGGKHLVFHFEVTMPEQPEENHRGKPKDVKSIGRKLAFKDRDDATSFVDADYHEIDTTGKSIFDLNFEKSQVGKRVSFLVFYISNRGETGPDSKSFEFFVN